jgi:ATP-dependent helicase/nuclease subunit B
MRQLHFLTSKELLLPSVTEFLLDLGTELKDTLVIVPTAQSGRQLRQQLPTQAKRAILAPAVTTAEVLFAPNKEARVADKIQWWTAWSETLRSYTDEELEDLFPVLDGVTRDFNWGLNAAQRFCKLKEEITSVDHSFASVAHHSEEAKRWELLANIDRDVKILLSDRKLRCPCEAKRYAAEHWKVPDGVKRIVIACVPDLPALAHKALNQCDLALDILIHADESLSEHFTEWGLPEESYWKQCELPLYGPQEAVIHMSATGHDAARELLRDLSQHHSDQITLAVTDQTYAPLVSDSLDTAGWPIFDPDGRLISKLGLWSFLKRFKQCLGHKPNFQHIQSLLKAPEARYLLKSIESPAIVAVKVDQLSKRYLPQNLGNAIYRADDILKPVLEELSDWLNTKSDSASRFIEKLFDRIERSPDFPTELIEPFIDVIDSVKALEKSNIRLTYAEALELVMASCEGVKIKNDRSGTVIDQLGWLETPYSIEPHLRIVGFHEGAVPERAHADGFLPESLRSNIQLYSRDQLNARDSYLLHSITASRSQNGSSKFYLSLSAPNGEERQASRLLMRCPAGELPARVQHCFQEELDDKNKLPAYSEGNWKLQLNHELQWPADRKLSISPSKLAAYLRCPFRFYLQQVEGFDRRDFDSQEMDAMQFGTLIHDVLELYGLHPEYKELSDDKEVEAAFTSLLYELFEKRYGFDTNLPLMIQRDSALNRLIAFAPKQAQMRRDGWQIKHVEYPIGHKEGETPWSFAETPVSMRIDRIDIHEGTGAIRLIDYKTSTKVKKPDEEHLENLRSSDAPHHVYGELLPPAPRRRAQRRWKNLQLPLYAEFVRQHFQTEALPEVAYIAFPAAASSTGLQAWANYDEVLHSSAMEWAQNCVQSIKENHFPIRELPSAMLAWDDFAALNPQGVESAFQLPTPE